MKEDLTKIIETTAKKTAEEVVGRQRLACRTNYYRVMERLLRSYKVLGRLTEAPEEYDFLPSKHSHSITAALSSGGVKDPDEVLESAAAARVESFLRTKGQYDSLDQVVRQFEARPEFVVIRMYYFNEDADGNDRPAGAKPYSFEEMADELSYRGIERSEKTLRVWRTRLVQDMTVAMFGVEGAVSVEARGERKDSDGDGPRA